MGTEISRWLGDLGKLHYTVSNCGSRIERSSLAERGPPVLSVRHPAAQNNSQRRAAQTHLRSVSIRQLEERRLITAA